MDDSDAPSAEAIREQCIRLLARREHTRRELARKLSQRGFEPADYESVLDQLIAENLLSEARFAEVYVRSRISAGYGPLKIRADLAERGVGGHLVAQLLDFGDDVWLEYCRAAWQRRFGQAPDTQREQGQQTRFLANRGFSGDHIRRVVRYSRD